MSQSGSLPSINNKRRHPPIEESALLFIEEVCSEDVLDDLGMSDEYRRKPAARTNEHRSNVKKTVVIFDNLEGNLKFLVYEGQDISHLNRKYVNSDEMSETDIETICSIMDLLPAEGLSTAKEWTFPVEAVREGASVVTIGFVP